MNIAAQIVPLLLILVYVAVTIFLITLAFRFVRAHERMASALENAAVSMRRQADKDGGVSPL